MTTLPRAATSPELTKLRSGNQSSRLFATFHQPATVFTARLASLPASNDNVSSISYNTGSGAGYTDILTDMRVDIGTTAGAYDLGTTRVHNLSGLGAVTGTLNIERTSEIAWTANCYITVLDAFDLRPRPPFTDSNGVDFMDTSVAYSDQHSKCKSTPIFPRYHVKWLPAGGTVQVVEDSTQSWALNNTINAWAWTAPGNSAISGSTTNTATITYNAANAHAGYRVQLDLTNTDNVDSTGYGRVFVLAAESDAYEITMPVTIAGNYQTGGWSAQITMYFDADRSIIRDRALVILHRKDWYGPASSDEGSLGYIAGDENIELVGWIAGESIKWLREDQPSYVTFTVQGPQYWLNRLTMPSVGLKNISSHPPTTWKRFTGLTAKSATWHILHWRTTAPVMMDCFPIDSGTGALQLQSGGAQTVWQQISNILNDFVIAKPCCDANARLFMQVEQNLLSASARSSIPTVMTITKDDWTNEINFDRKVLNNVALVDFNGDVYDGTNTTKVYALCPGRTFASSGASPFVRERLAVTDQASINTLAGAAFGWKNPNYPNWRFVLASNMHLIDLAPYQYLSIDIASSDTPRGITVSGLRLIPRDIKRTFADGIVTPEVTIEAESTIFTGITGDTPQTPPVVPVSPPPILPPPPAPVPTPSGNAKEIWLMLINAGTNILAWSGDIGTGGQPSWNVYNLPTFAGYDGQGQYSFWVSEHGERLFTQAADTGNSNKKTLFEMSNLSVVRAIPSTTPTWSTLAISDGAYTINGHLVDVLGTTAPNPFRSAGNTLYYAFYDHVNTYIGANAGGAWTLYQRNITGFGTSGGIGGTVYLSKSIIATPTTAHVITSDATVDTFTMVFGQGGGFDWWTRADANNAFWFYYPKNGGTAGHALLRHGGADVLDLTYTGGSFPQWTIRGAPNGNQAYTVNAQTNDIYLSDDGVSFSVIANWRDSWVWDEAVAGGGTLLAGVRGSINNGEVPLRRYTRAGVATDLTGDFWTKVNKASVQIVGMNLVYG